MRGHELISELKVDGVRRIWKVLAIIALGAALALALLNGWYYG